MPLIFDGECKVGIKIHTSKRAMKINVFNIFKFGVILI